MTAPILATQRLVLRQHHPDDLDALAAMWAHPAVYSMIGGTPRAREDVWIRLLRSIGQWSAFGYGSWVAHDAVTDALVGEVGLLEARRAIVPAIDDRPEMGWTLSPDRHGQGYAMEALTAVLAWCERQGIARTVCIIDPGNAPSIRLATRVGYALRTVGAYHDKPIGIYDRG